MERDDLLMVVFDSREAAGQEIGRRLAARESLPDIVMGLPRGGVVVAAEVARMLQRPLSVIVVRKIGHPRQREFAVGALAEPDVLVLDQVAIRESQVSQGELEEVIAEERQRLGSYQTRFHAANEPVLAGTSVVIVDDGLATGATAEAAAISARKQGAREIIVAAPVASTAAVARLSAVADEVWVLVIDPEFVAVGQYYRHFPQTVDEEVLILLHLHA